jgi:hypothetical protein
VVALVVVALGGCGSSPAAAPARPSSKTADLALARKGLIVLADLPSSWTASGKITSGSGSGANVPTAKIASCLGVARSEISAAWPTENSPSFDNAQGTSSVNDEVQTFPSPARAATDFSTFSNPKTPACVTSVLGPLLRDDVKKGGGQGATVGTITSTRQSFPAVGDRSGEIQIQVPISASNVRTSLYIDLLDIVEGRLESTISLTNPGAPFDQTVAAQIAGAAVRHMS